MTTSFKWADIYSVGNELIDGQHKNMFEIANSIPENFTDKSLKKTIVNLYKHALKHFDAEEGLMKQTGYENTAEHIRQHNNLVSRLNDITEKPFRTDEDLLKFKKFVYGWIIEHIMQQDKMFFDFIKRQKKT